MHFVYVSCAKRHPIRCDNLTRGKQGIVVVWREVWQLVSTNLLAGKWTTTYVGLVAWMAGRSTREPISLHRSRRRKDPRLRRRRSATSHYGLLEENFVSMKVLEFEPVMILRLGRELLLLLSLGWRRARGRIGEHNERDNNGSVGTEEDKRPVIVSYERSAEERMRGSRAEWGIEREVRMSGGGTAVEDRGKVYIGTLWRRWLVETKMIKILPWMLQEPSWSSPFSEPLLLEDEEVGHGQSAKLSRMAQTRIWNESSDIFLNVRNVSNSV